MTDDTALRKSLNVGLRMLPDRFAAGATAYFGSTNAQNMKKNFMGPPPRVLWRNFVTGKVCNLCGESVKNYDAAELRYRESPWEYV
jgi:hypothetical protein